VGNPELLVEVADPKTPIPLLLAFRNCPPKLPGLKPGLLVAETLPKTPVPMLLALVP
jgi:hypothetical protein